jgi:hypothetical protein
MSDLAIRVDHLSKRYPSTQLRTGTIGALQQRHDTLQDAIADFRLQIFDLTRPNRKSKMPGTAGHAVENRSSEELWSLRGSDPLAFDASSPGEF